MQTVKISTSNGFITHILGEVCSLQHPLPSTDALRLLVDISSTATTSQTKFSRLFICPIYTYPTKFVQPNRPISDFDSSPHNLTIFIYAF